MRRVVLGLCLPFLVGCTEDAALQIATENVRAIAELRAELDLEKKNRRNMDDLHSKWFTGKPNDWGNNK